MASLDEVYEFGPYALDVGERRLSNAGRVVPLPPKAHDVLVALVRHAGTLVTKRALLDLVWGDVSVEEGVLSVYVSALRKCLGDTGATATYIETVPRAGYRFSAAVTRRPTISAATLSMKWPIGVLPATPEVSDLIGRGRACLMSASRAEIPRGVEAFRSAIALDPDYAAAHAGLAVAHCTEAELRLVSPDVAYTSARVAALRALELNAAHTEGWLLYGRLLESLGYLAEGLAAKQRVLERDRSSASVHLQIALSYWNQRRYDDMIAWANRSLALDPQHLLAREYLAGAYLKKGDLDRHMVEVLTHARAAGAPQTLLDDLRRTYDARGRAGIVELALRLNADGPPMQLALLHGEAGNMDEAFRHLDDAIARRDPALVQIAVAPQWDWLRIDDRFDERLEAMGLADAVDRAQRYLTQASASAPPPAAT